MAKPKNRPERTRHPTLWTVEALRWEFREHESEYQRLLAKKGEKSPGVTLGQQIAAVHVDDRELAVAIGRHFLDRFAEEAAGRMSLEIHVHPPQRDVEDESVYRVSEEVLEQARQLGLEGDVERQVRRMTKEGTPFTHPTANVRHGRFALQLVGNDIVWIDSVDAPGGGGKTE